MSTTKKVAEASTRERMIQAGLELLLERGYHGLGTQELLTRARAPKGSFYHHFADKQDFALQVVDAYMAGVHQVLDLCVDNEALAPLDRIRAFFNTVRTGYLQDGYLGCLLGGLGQELSGTDPVFATRIGECLGYIGSRLAECVAAAQESGDLDPDLDPVTFAGRLVDCWEGAALRSRLIRSEEPLMPMVEFCLAAGAPRG